MFSSVSLKTTLVSAQECVCAPLGLLVLGAIKALRSCQWMWGLSAAVATAEGFYKPDTQLRM